MVVEQDAEVGVDLEGTPVEQESVDERECGPNQTDDEHGDDEPVQTDRSFGQRLIDRRPDHCGKRHLEQHGQRGECERPEVGDPVVEHDGQHAPDPAE